MPYNETYQYAPGIGYPGQVADMSNCDIFSRTVETPAGIGFGVPVAAGLAEDTIRLLGGPTYDATVTADGDNTGNPTLTLLTTGSFGTATQVGTYTIRAVSASNGGRFNVEAPDGTELPHANTGTAFRSNQLNFTITAGGTGVAIDDLFEVEVVEVDPTANDIIGFTVRSQAVSPDSVNTFPVGETAAVMRWGAMLVTVSEAVGHDDPAYVTLADSSIGKTPGDGKVKLGTSYFERSAASGGIAKLRIVK